MQMCECGCGQEVARRFVHGHHKQGSVWSEHQRTAFLGAMTGRKRSPEEIASMRASWTPERRKLQSERMQGHEVSDETKRKISENHRAKNIRPSHEAQVKSNAGRGIREKNPSWRGGTTIYPNGYRLLYRPEHPRAHPNGYVYEHILVAEATLGRPLVKGEVVHHIDHDRLNNSPDNLQVFVSHSEHLRREHQETRGLRVIV